MPARKLGKQELQDIVWGSTVLGSGGGGNPRDGLRLVESIPEITLLDVNELPDNARSCFVAAVGAPTALSRVQFGIQAVYAYEGLIRVAAMGGIKVDYIMPGEIGGLNSITPLFVAARKNIAVLDSASGRAGPQLSTSLYRIHRLPLSPLVMADEKGTVIVAYLADPLDISTVGKITRPLAASFGNQAGIATCIIDIATIKKCLSPGSVTRAEVIGRIIREARAAGRDAPSEVIAFTGGKELFRGTIKKFEIITAESFDFGKATVQGSGRYHGRTMVLDSKNENMIAWDDGSPIATVPDIITTMTVSGEPFTNADAKEGMEIVVIGIPAPEPYVRTQEGLKVWEDIFTRIGYRGSYVTPFK
ncbi:MAG: DUF917 domain-containing protein [Chloroflexi bacterium]|nr:DUF917 domain-containing protein [Chloroflexota bacterium]